MNLSNELGYKSVVVIGHQDYYPKFGYQLASKFAISFTFDVPQENSFSIELVQDGLAGVHGDLFMIQHFSKHRRNGGLKKMIKKIK